MPPRLELLSRSAQVISRPSYQPIAPFLYPFLGQQRAASILSQLSDTPGAYNKRIRRGRGPASGKGKTSGRGQKGQKAHGKVPTGFNGGQTPESVRHPEKGFDNVFSIEFSPINLNRIQYWINQGRLDPTQPITLKELNKSRCTHGIKPGGVKLLARGKEELTTPIHIVVSRASAEAINAVEKLGGSVTTRYYTGFAVKKILAGHMDPINSLQSRIRFAPETEEGAEAVDGDLMLERRKYHYRLPDPASRKAIEYYRDSAHRGYLSHLVGEGQGPSLYFRTPGARSGKEKTAAGPVKQKSKTSENRLW